MQTWGLRFSGSTRRDHTASDDDTGGFEARNLEPTRKLIHPWFSGVQESGWYHKLMHSRAVSGGVSPVSPKSIELTWSSWCTVYG